MIRISRRFVKMLFLLIAAIGVFAAVGYVAAFSYRFATQDTPQVVSSPSTRADSQTLFIDLSGQRVSDLTLSDIDTGSDSVVLALEVKGSPGVPVYIESLTIDALSCHTVDFIDVDAATLVVSDNTVDGLSLSYSVTSTPDVNISSLRGAFPLTFSGSSVDRIVVDGGVLGGEVKNFVIQDVRAHGAPCEFRDLSIGTLTFTNGLIGSGSGIDNADLLFQPSVQVGSVTSTGNIERPVLVR